MQGLFILFHLLVQPIPVNHHNIVINEIQAKHANELHPDDSLATDWIELKNTGFEPVSLQNWYLSDDFGKPKKWQITENLILQPDSLVLFYANGADNKRNTNFRLSGAGEEVVLTNSTGSCTDSISYNFLPAGISKGRNHAGTWKYFMQPTPGTQNIYASFEGIAPQPWFYPAPEAFRLKKASFISMHAGEKFSIHFTLDGSIPTLESPVYMAPFKAEDVVVLRARAFHKEYIASSVATATFFSNEGDASLPVFSVVSSPDNFYGDSTGIYVIGKNGVDGYCMPNVKRNYCRDWERPAHVEIFEPDGSYHAQELGVKIHGRCSRNFSQRSLAFFARREYDAGELPFALFPSLPMKKYEAFILRNSGNDFGHSMFRDALMSEIAKDKMQTDVQAYRPVRVFLNGRYHGLYNLREKLNEHYIAGRYGISAAQVVLMEESDQVMHGNAAELFDIKNYLMDTAVGIDKKTARILSVIDVESYIDYMVAQMYCVNTDWPMKNVKYWKSEETDEKWRWILFDTDMGFNIRGHGEDTDMFRHIFRTFESYDEPSSTLLIFSILWQSEGFRVHFRERCTKHLQTTFHPQRVMTIIDSIAAIIRPEIPHQERRWGLFTADWEKEVEELKAFARNRPHQMELHLQHWLKYQGGSNY